MEKKVRTKAHELGTLCPGRKGAWGILDQGWRTKLTESDSMTYHRGMGLSWLSIKLSLSTKPSLLKKKKEQNEDLIFPILWIPCYFMPAGRKASHTQGGCQKLGKGTASPRSHSSSASYCQSWSNLTREMGSWSTKCSIVRNEPQCPFLRSRGKTRDTQIKHDRIFHSVQDCVPCQNASTSLFSAESILSPAP